MSRADAISAPREAVVHSITPAARRPAGGAGGAERTADEAARERALLAAMRAGDRTARDELVLGCEERVYATCVRMVGDPELARDLAHDTLVKAIVGLADFDGRSRVSTWVTRIAMNVCLTELRRRRVRRAASLEALAEQWVGEPGAGRWGLEGREPGASERVEGEEELARLGLAMLSLAPDQRAILMLRDLHDLDYRQIAETLGVAVGTVKSRLFRARVALREAMEGQEGGGDG